MNLTQLFRSYELLADKAETAFQRVGEEYGAYIKCERHCADCCHAVFGLFLIEAAYIREHFEQIDEEQKRRTLIRADEADQELERIQKRLKAFEDDPQMQIYTLARERIRCPLLDDRDECILYQRRPITCRVYGIPTKIQGKAHVCGKSGFSPGETYPVFDLDGAYKDLFSLSKGILDEAGIHSEDKASLLISMSKAVRTPLDDLIKEDFK